MHRTFIILGFAVLLVAAAERAAIAKDVSGPQVGEQLTPFTMRGVLDDEAGKAIDLVKDSAGRPLVLFFLHERTRPSVVLARQVLNDAAGRKADGLDAGLVLLAADAPAMEEWIKIAVQSLPRGVPIGISTDGAGGPPAYNLNRNVQVTVIVAKDNRVVANFALATPSPDDAPKIIEAIASAVGQKK